MGFGVVGFAMKIPVTGIGNTAESTSREIVAHKFPDQVIQMDMDQVRP